MKRGEEKRRRIRIRRREEKSRYGIFFVRIFLWIFVWICIRILVWRFGILLFVYNSCLKWLFGLVVVLNGGKICIEKKNWVLGEMLSVFFKPMFLFWP